MKKEELIRKIKRKSDLDRKNRKDSRFLDTMGFLMAKGFLRANFRVPLLPNKRLRVEDAIWAGLNVEPRILEVLPAAVLRLGKHFDFDAEVYPDLARLLGQLRARKEEGDAFFDVRYAKLRIWTEFPLKDGRVKSLAHKKVAKTFRLSPKALDRLKIISLAKGCTETESLESLILN